MSRPAGRIELPPDFNYEAHKQAHPLAPCAGPTVQNATIIFDTVDAPSRRDRILATVRCDEHKKARHYVAELEISKDGGASVVKRRRTAVGAKRDNDQNTTVDVHMGRVNPKWKVRFRVRADDDSCMGAWKPGTSLVASDAEAGWSDWFDPNDDEIPPAVTLLTLDVDQHRSYGKWDVPTEAGNPDIPDLRISHLWVELWKDTLDTGTLIKRDRYHHGEKIHIRNPKPGAATYHLRVFTVSHTGRKSVVATTSATRTTPSTPGPPTVAFDAGGTRLAKYRAHVTVATVADTDAEIAKYIVQLVHKSANVAPTAGDKRSHGRVDGDATGDDLIETFRGIPRNHFVFARTRAIDTQGRRSAYSAWTAAGQPSASAEDDGADPGTIKRHAGASIPVGYLLCDGASYATAAQPDLFAAIGYLHGGSGPNFNVPDTRGRHGVGVGTNFALGGTEAVAEVSRTHEHDVHGAHPAHGNHAGHGGHGGHGGHNEHANEGSHSHSVNSGNSDSTVNINTDSGVHGTGHTVDSSSHDHGGGTYATNANVSGGGNAAGADNQRASLGHSHTNITGLSGSTSHGHGLTGGGVHQHAASNFGGRTSTTDIHSHGLHGAHTGHDAHDAHSAHAEHGSGEHDNTPGSRGHRRHPHLVVNYIIHV